MNINKRTLTITAIAVLFVGAGSAALLDTFGTVQADSDVQQSVHFGETDDGVDDEVTAVYDGGVVAGTTHTDTFTLHNDAERPALVRLDSNVNPKDWGADPDGGEKGISQTVYEGEYETSSFDLVGQKYGDTQSFSTNYDVVVSPNEDTVNYTIDFPNSATGVDLEISRADGNNYHVKYDGTDFHYKDPSSSGTLQPASDLEEFEAGNYDDAENTVEISVEKEASQTFSAHLMGEFDSFASAVTRKALQKDDGTGIEFYEDTETDHHQEPELGLVYDEEVIGDKLTLDSDSERNFQVETVFDVALAPEPDDPVSNENYDDEVGAYEVDLDVVPVTDDGEVQES